MFRRVITACTAMVVMLALTAPADAHRRRLHWIDVALHLAWAGWWLESVPRPVRPQVSPSEDMTVVEFHVVPDHARVALDGQLIGVAADFSGDPDFLYLRPGTYHLEVSLGGYQAEHFELEAKPGRYYPLEVRLKRVRGESRTPWWEKPEGVVGGRVFGPARTEAQERPEPGPDPSLRSDLRLERETEGAAELSAASTGALEFRITPGDATVFLDGVFLGTGEELSRLERGLAVTPGPHLVEVVAPGREPVRIEVSVEEGARYPIELTLDHANGLVPKTGQEGEEGVY